MLLIGSRALGLRCRKALLREPLDFDFVTTREEFERFDLSKLGKLKKDPYEVDGGTKICVEGDSIAEFELVQTGSSNEVLLELAAAEVIKTSVGDVPSLDLLFAIKTSHRHKKNSPHFWKNFADWHSMKRCGAKIREEHKTFLKLREKESYAAQKHPSLAQNKESFFKDDGIAYKFVHDDLHKSVMLFDVPAYELYLKDGEEVQTDKNKFFALPLERRLAGVVEEALVLALERSLIPHPGVLSPEKAFMLALSKVCTSITSGYFRQFAYENGLDVIALYKATSSQFYEKFLSDVDSGKIREAL
jgi:hypothetical protein